MTTAVVKSFRIDPELWQRFEAKCSEQREKPSVVVADMVGSYVLGGAPTEPYRGLTQAVKAGLVTRGFHGVTALGESIPEAAPGSRLKKK